MDVQKLQLFAWQSENRGGDVHLHANPTQGELLHAQFREKKEMHKETAKVGVLAKYGGEEYLAAPPKELLTGQTEEYVEYSRTGMVIKGKERVKTRSKYAEDSKSIIYSPWYDADFCLQSISTTTAVFGDHGMTLARGNGATHAATRCCMHPIVPGRLPLKLRKQRARKAYYNFRQVPTKNGPRRKRLNRRKLLRRARHGMMRLPSGD